MIPTPLAVKFLLGAQSIISVGGFDATVSRTTSGGIDPDDPMGPPVETVETWACRIFIDKPKTKYFNGGLTQFGDGYVYVDLLSIDVNSVNLITWQLENGDVINRTGGAKCTVSDASAPEANGVPCVSEGVVTYNV